MDFSLAKEALEMPSAPDVLLLASDLAPFVKVTLINTVLSSNFKIGRGYDV
jgi:DNA polymerase alpha subunit B